MSPIDETTKVYLTNFRERIDKLEGKVDDKADTSDLNALVEEVRGLRKTLIGFAFTIAGSAIVFAFTVFSLLQP